jgi:hypothetical protein
VVEEQRGSGQSIVKFCGERGIAVHSFHYHKRRIGEQADGGGFRRVRIGGSSGVRLVLEAGQWQVLVDRGFDGLCLRQVVEVLG